MSTQVSLSRPRCHRCQRPLSHCLCAHVTEVSSRTRVLILQHPDEHKHPLNTGRLATLGLQQAELWIGEQFPELEAAISASPRAFLLFTGPDAQMPHAWGPGSGASPGLLVVPDGTWRKARKILSANPVLNTLPRLSLPAGEPSRYRVRQTREPAAVSTIEAIVRTLAVLEPDQDFRPVLRPFDVLVDQQILAMGPDLYHKNYQRSESDGNAG